MPDRQHILMALSLMPGLGDVNLKHLTSHYDPVELYQTPRAKLSKVPGLSERFARSFKVDQYLPAAEDELQKASDLGIHITFLPNSDYPDRLRQAHDSPFRIYYKGKGDLNAKRTIGIVGTRHATSYGREVTEKICHEAAAYDCQIISGLAYGIDISAHRMALQNQLSTHAVLGSGVDVIYPAAHKTTAAQLQDNGCLISEQPIGEKPEAYHFPARNRIIAAMSDALIVVEAAARGGALITAQIANSYNKEVFAVPGNLNQTFSIGCNRLIKNMQASIYDEFESVARVLGWKEALKKESAMARINRSELSEEEISVIGILERTTDIHIDELAWQSNISLNKLAGILLNLEFKALVRPVPGKKYKLAIG